ncbi:hypothetical protein [Microbulbifer halophilus]|uniref:Phage protein n=1 Tax=Microbulbifer halophilus TaxID=453963 RepID=A0ABW5EBK0_9GAMM|nr:hypothetical protein [Microbulbifer halophilus]MCW8125763.1 hypothetical protein [Microbulbifer halophilus]
MNAKVQKTACTPEEVFDIASTGEGFYVDALNCGLERLHGTVTMLSAHFEADCDRLNEEIVSNALWAVEGQVNDLKKLLSLATAEKN